MSTVDPVGALVTILAADTTIATLTSGRVYGSELPESVTPSMPLACVVVRRAGGAQQIGQGYLTHGDARYDVHCYGATPREADQLHVATHLVLKQMRRTVAANTILHWVRPAAGPIASRDPELQWPFVLASYQVLAGETPAT